MKVCLRFFEFLISHLSGSTGKSIYVVEDKFPHANREVKDQHQPAYEIHKGCHKNRKRHTDLFNLTLYRACLLSSISCQCFILRNFISILLIGLVLPRSCFVRALWFSCFVRTLYFSCLIILDRQCLIQKSSWFSLILGLDCLYASLCLHFCFIQKQIWGHKHKANYHRATHSEFKRLKWPPFLMKNIINTRKSTYWWPILIWLTVKNPERIEKYCKNPISDNHSVPNNNDNTVLLVISITVWLWAYAEWYK